MKLEMTFLEKLRPDVSLGEILPRIQAYNELYQKYSSHNNNTGSYCYNYMELLENGNPEAKATLERMRTEGRDMLAKLEVEKHLMEVEFG